MSEDATFLSFPPRAVTDDPLRISVLWNSDVGIVLDKPPGIPVFQDSRLGGGAGSLLSAIREKAAVDGSQFDRLGLRSLAVVNQLARENSGAVLYTKNREGKAALKNAMGSSLFTFRYRFLSAGIIEGDEAVCDLPVAIHREKPLALVSHTTGKKATTRFRRLEVLDGCSLWESESAYDRFHQVRLHAAEVGVPIAGDEIYTNIGKRRGANAGSTVDSALGGEPFFLHLFSLRFPVGDQWVEVEAPYPRDLELLLRKRGQPSA